MPPWLASSQPEELLLLQQQQQPAASAAPALPLLAAQAVPLDEAARVYPQVLAEQLARLAQRPERPREEEAEEEGSGGPVVRAGGVPVPLERLTSAHVLAMSEDEYRGYYAVHQAECAARLKKLFM